MPETSTKHWGKRLMTRLTGCDDAPGRENGGGPRQVAGMTKGLLGAWKRFRCQKKHNWLLVRDRDLQGWEDPLGKPLRVPIHVAKESLLGPLPVLFSQGSLCPWGPSSPSLPSHLPSRAPFVLQVPLVRGACEGGGKRHIIPVLIEALFMAARTLRQSRCPLTDEWIKKKWYKYKYGILLSHRKGQL